MPNSPRMGWPYPAENAEQWFKSFESFVNAMDTSGFASREDRQFILAGGGTVTWNSTTGTLEWTDDLHLVSAISGFRISAEAASVTLTEGQLMYVTVIRAPTQNITTTPSIGVQVPDTDNSVLYAARIGDRLYWRNGLMMQNGESFSTVGASQGGSTTDPNAIHVNVDSEILGIALKGSPVTGDLVVIEDSADGYNKKRATVGTLPVTDSTAIHDNVAAEINAVAEKTTPVGADLVIIEDSETTPTAYEKKKVQLTNLLAGASSPFEADSGNNEIQPITADIGRSFVVGSQSTEDSGASNDARMFFEKTGGAFRAGVANSDEWDSSFRGAGSVAFGTNCTAEGANSHAEGDTCYAEAAHSFARGKGAYAYHANSEAFSGNTTLGAGFGQVLRIAAGTTTADATPKELSLDYTGVSSDIEISNGSAWGFIVKVMGRRDVALGDTYFAIFEGAVKAGSSAVGLVPGPSPLLPRFTVADSGASGWSVQIEDDTGSRFVIKVTGGAYNVLWMAEIHAVELFTAPELIE